MDFPRPARNKAIWLAGLSLVVVRAVAAVNDLPMGRISPITALLVIGGILFIVVNAAQGGDFTLFCLHALCGGKALYMAVPPHSSPITTFQTVQIVWFGTMCIVVSLAWWEKQMEFEMPIAESLIKWRTREASRAYPRSQPKLRDR